VKATPLSLPGVLLIEPEVFGDARGYFSETYSMPRYEQLGIPPFVQDNVSRSATGILRGLHLQHPHGQGKLVFALQGEVFDVAVDVRHGSPTFGQTASAVLSEDNHKQLYVPPGFAHGFCVIRGPALFVYKCTALYHREAELGVAWNDPDLAISWPVQDPVLSDKDRQHPRLRDIAKDRLPPHV
jgi:dTDP-4-dehydrorhamnose 3,5-epimerase